MASYVLAKNLLVSLYIYLFSIIIVLPSKPVHKNNSILGLKQLYIQLKEKFLQLRENSHLPEEILSSPFTNYYKEKVHLLLWEILLTGRISPYLQLELESVYS